jgi:hypothetical protein
MPTYHLYVNQYLVTPNNSKNLCKYKYNFYNKKIFYFFSEFFLRFLVLVIFSVDDILVSTLISNLQSIVGVGDGEREGVGDCDGEREGVGDFLGGLRHPKTFFIKSIKFSI